MAEQRGRGDRDQRPVAGGSPPVAAAPAPRPRKVSVGSFRVPVSEPASDRGRDDVVSRARRHFRSVELGPRPRVDPDESVRRGPRAPAGRPPLLGRRPLGGGLLGGGHYGDDDDLD